ncbi:MAG: hypothetical protein WCI71_03020, partial [Bacteroidota bacterium]
MTEHTRDTESFDNYNWLKEKLTIAIGLLEKTSDLREAKGYLIEVQDHFKGLKLLREGREELYNRLQQAFNEINEKIELERKEATLEATRNFTILKDHLKNTIDTVLNSEDYRLSKELLREEQTTWREAKLFREHRDALYSSIQDAYTILTIRQEEDQKKSGQQADIAFAELKPKALELLRLANISVEFRTLRDQLKDIQARIREATLRKEHREELN